MLLPNTDKLSHGGTFSSSLQNIVQGLLLFGLTGVIITGITLRDEVKRHGQILSQIEPLLARTDDAQQSNSTRIEVHRAELNDLRRDLMSLETRVQTLERMRDSAPFPNGELP